MPLLKEGIMYWYVVCDECNSTEELLEQEDFPDRRDALTELQNMGWELDGVNVVICSDCLNLE